MDKVIETLREAQIDDEELVAILEVARLALREQGSPVIEADLASEYAGQLYKKLNKMMGVAVVRDWLIALFDQRKDTNDHEALVFCVVRSNNVEIMSDRFDFLSNGTRLKPEGLDMRQLLDMADCMLVGRDDNVAGVPLNQEIGDVYGSGITWKGTPAWPAGKLDVFRMVPFDVQV